MKTLSHCFRRLLLLVLLTSLALYRWVISPLLHTLAGPGMGCRFVPSCSEYAREALQNHGPFRGAMLCGKRICRCHPWGRSGWDPVPPSSITLSQMKGTTSLPTHRHHG